MRYEQNIYLFKKNCERDKERNRKNTFKKPRLNASEKEIEKL